MSESQHGALRLRVKRIESVTPEINRYTFGAADGSWLPPFSGGSHITVLIPADEGTKRKTSCARLLTGMLSLPSSPAPSRSKKPL